MLFQLVARVRQADGGTIPILKCASGDSGDTEPGTMRRNNVISSGGRGQ